ncbi:MAG: tyrosine--tRNA ligase [Rhodospirillales bacterium]|nr:tyrosine--tRNA ligase [Alphaproteobacteria bacterium]MCB9986766.1 tyrosine--tRNA ligase [Rhodospirillales bacterium]USO08463.1 MAG: tyrosine--tRNA ligase [Rhodospirillales bacterium]
MAYKSEFLNVMHARGFIHQCSDFNGLDHRLLEGTQSAYIGFDATAPSLHVGNLVQIMMLAWFQRCGHRPITLMGGGTTRVGDPSGKDEARKLLSVQTINDNIAGIQKVFANFIDYGTDQAMMANNDSWLATLNYIDFLRDVGRHFSINRMLTMDSVKLRLEREQPLSFIEFNYMILQSYDFVELCKRHGTILQMGGADQWGNIVNGVELGRRMHGYALYALTTPLLTTADGKKMGKTAAGAVWLNAAMLPVYDYWQFWRNTADADVGRFLKLFTFLPLDEIARLEALGGTEINEAKKILATEACALCHGREAAQAAEETARRTFEDNAAGADLPSVTIARAQLEAGITLIDLLKQVGFAASNGEARRLIQGGGAYVNDNPVESDAFKCTLDHLGADGSIKISSGKKKHALVRPA